MSSRAFYLSFVDLPVYLNSTRKGKVMSCAGGDHDFKLAGVYAHVRRHRMSEGCKIDLYDKYYCARCLQQRYKLNFSSSNSDDLLKYRTYPPVSTSVLARLKEDELEEIGVMPEVSMKRSYYGPDGGVSG